MNKREYTVKVEFGAYEFNGVLAESPQEAVQTIMRQATEHIFPQLLAQAMISVTPERNRWRWPRGKSFAEAWEEHED